MTAVGSLRIPARAPAPAARAARAARAAAPCRAQAAPQPAAAAPPPLAARLARGAAAAAAAALLAAAPLAARANEFDLLAAGTPATYVIDDAGVLNKTTEKSVGDALRALEAETGYRLEVATLRKLEFESDAFAFGDKLIGKWFKGDTAKRGVLLVVTTAKDGALTGGGAFMKALGDQVIDSVVGDNIPVFTEQEKYNEAVTSSVNRVAAVLSGRIDPGPPARADGARKRTYKTRGETAANKPATSTIVLTLLGISFIVPMLQYLGECSRALGRPGRSGKRPGNRSKRRTTHQLPTAAPNKIAGYTNSDE